MKDELKNRSQGQFEGEQVDTEKVSSKRRKVLKGAGVAAAAGAIWHKPVLDSVVTPAHAQTTAEEPQQIVLAGSTGTTGIAQHINGTQKSVLAKVVDTIVPPANAAVVDEFEYICSALTDDMYSGDDYTHCVSITLPEGENPNGVFTLGLEGPDVYYSRVWGCFDYSTNPYTVYYQGATNFGGMATGTLADRCIDVTIGDVAIKGEITEDFTSASGSIGLINNSVSTGSGFCGTLGESGYGAYWNVDLTGGSCSIGSGVNTADYNISTDYLSYCPS